MERVPFSQIESEIRINRKAPYVFIFMALSAVNVLSYFNKMSSGSIKPGGATEEIAAHIFGVAIGTTILSAAFRIIGSVVADTADKNGFIYGMFFGKKLSDSEMATAIEKDNAQYKKNDDSSVPAQRQTEGTADAISNTKNEDISNALLLAEIEIKKAGEISRIRLAEAQGLAGIAVELADKEEARQDRQLDKLTKI